MKHLWWQDLVACPSCKSKTLQWPKDSLDTGGCGKCKRSFHQNNNVLIWNKTTPPIKFNLWVFLFRAFRSCIHPISSRLLPFYYLAEWRQDRYHQRTLVDIDLAKKWVDHYLKGFHLPPGATVLDFGCGRGRVTAMLSLLGLKVVGEDRKMQPFWHDVPGAGFQEVEGVRLPFGDAGFDLVVESQVIHYIEEADLLGHIQEIRRVLKPGGYWMLLEGNSASAGAREMRRQIGRVYELEWLQKLITTNGFVIMDQSFEGFYAPHFPMVINYIRKFLTFRRFDFFDHEGWLVKKIKPQKRGMCLMRLKRFSA